MARQLGSGKATGKIAGSQTSGRLIGGVASMSTAGALAGKSITPPSLRVSARNVDTYFNPGKINAPTPAMMFAPPQIPDTSQDLVRLSKSLGMLSRPLEQMGANAVQAEVQREEEIKASAQATQRLITQQYPGQDFATARDAIEKKAAAGDKQAKDLWVHMQAQSPLHMGYVNRYISMSNLRQDLDTAADRWDKMDNVAGTQIDINTNKPILVPMEELEPGDPRLMSAMTGLLRIPDDPVVIAQFEPLIYGKYSELTKNHAARHAEYKKRTFIRSLNSVQASALASPNLTPNQSANVISALLTDGRNVLGVEGYKEVLESIGPQLTAIATQLSTVLHLDDGSTIGLDDPVPEGRLVRKTEVIPELQLHYLHRTLSIFDRIKAGPNGELLKDRLGDKGSADARIKIYQDVLKTTNSIASSVNTAEKNQGNKLGELSASQAGLDDPDVYLNPDKLAAAMAKAGNLIANDPVYKNNPLVQKAALSYLAEYATSKRRVYSDPVQELYKNEAAKIVDDPMLNAEQKRVRLDGLVTRGLAPKNARQYYKAIGDMHRSENDGHDKAMLKEIKKQRTQLENVLKKKGVGKENFNWLSEYYEFFEGANGLTARRAKNRRIMLSKPMPKAYDGSEEQWVVERELLWRQSDLKLVTDSADSIKKLGTEVLGVQQSEIISLNEAQFRRTDINNYRRAVGRKNILSTSEFTAELNTLVSRNELSPKMIKLLRHVQYTGRKDGQGVGDFFMTQWKMHYPNKPIPQEVKRRLLEANDDSANRGIKRFSRGRSISDTEEKRDQERASIRRPSLAGLLVASFLGGPVSAHEMPYKTLPAVDGDHGGLFALTRSGETLPGTNPYINAFPNTTIPGLDQLSLRQVYNLSKKNNNQALGAVQIQAVTLKDVIDLNWAEVNWDDTFDRKTQEKIFWGLITANKKAKDFLHGRTPYSNEGINAVAETMYKTWAALPMPNGKSYYKNNTAHVSVTDFREAIIRARESITGEHFHQR